MTFRYFSIIILGLNSISLKYPNIRRLLLVIPGVRPFFRRFIPKNDTVSRDYEEWIQIFENSSDITSLEIRRDIENLQHLPFLAIVMPVYDTPADFLRASIESVRCQLWPRWQLCIADDASPAPHVKNILKSYEDDHRISTIYREKNGHICAATNSALNLVSAEWVVLLDHDDLLSNQALYRVALEIIANPDAQIIYSDEDKIDSYGKRFDPYFKAEFDPDLLLGHNMVSHLGVYRTDLMRTLGGMREGLEGSQDYDLVLRALRYVKQENIIHIPHILYHWRQQADSQRTFSETETDRCILAGRKAIRDYLIEKGVSGFQIGSAPRIESWNRVYWPIKNPMPKVSIIVNCRDDMEAGKIVKRLRKYISLKDVEIIVPTITRHTDNPKDFKWVIYREAQNWVDLSNDAAKFANGEVLIFMDGDSLPISENWIEQLVSLAMRPEIGVVGAKILSSSGDKILDAGLVFGLSDVFTPAYRGTSAASLGYMGALALVRRVSAISAACITVRTGLFRDMAGFDGGDIADLSHIDLCLRLNRRGYQTLWTPHVSLVCISDIHPDQDKPYTVAAEALRRRWGNVLNKDPWLSEMLTFQEGDVVLRF